MPFLLRCWLITSIGENPTPARSRWAKEEAPPAREVQAGLNIYSEGALSLFIGILYWFPRIDLSALNPKLILRDILNLRGIRPKNTVLRDTSNTSPISVTSSKSIDPHIIKHSSRVQPAENRAPKNCLLSENKFSGEPFSHGSLLQSSSGIG